MPHGLLSYSGELPHHRSRQGNDGVCLKLGMRFNRSRAQVITVMALGICTLIYFTFMFYLTDNVIIDDQFLSAVPDSVLEKRLDFQSMVIDRMCSDVTNVCYTVNDIKNEEEVSRHLIVDGFDGESDTVMRLVPPNNARFDTSDTRIWTINYLEIDTQYLAALLVSPFLISALSLEKNADEGKSILEIGLGGGSFMMALNHYKPEVNITTLELDPIVLQLAHKWFGITDNERRHAILGDGLDYLKQMNKTGTKFDIIVLDACDIDIQVPCPATVFRNRKSVQLILDSLKPSGVVLVNILAFPERDGSPIEVVGMFSEVFQTCLQLKMTKEYNIIMICMSYTIGDVNQQITFYQSRLQAVTEALSVTNILQNIEVSKN
ncbi:unnamed protein product [Auanema sp. JU1783]|nr:unnamed protein product [Auanema sp. JU1783]